MTKKSKIAILVGIIVLVVIGVYLSNSLERFGICRPGTEFVKVHMNPDRSACLPLPPASAPKNLNGPCDKKTDCGTATCVLRDANKTTGRGICLDWTQDFQSDYYLDEDGNITIFSNFVQ